jgi:hypothetical protein
MSNAISLLARSSIEYLRRLFLISLPAIVITVLVIEGLLRVSGYTPYYLDGHAFIPSQDPDLIWELRPGFQGLYAGVPISINSYGFRGRGPGRGELARMLIVGDSIAFGQGVREDQTLAEQLNGRLQKDFGSPVEVLNLGVPGYDTCQEYLSLKYHILSLNPQVVVLLYAENDTDPPVFQVNGDSVVTPDVRVGWFADLMAAARKQSAVYNLVWTRWQILKNPSYGINEYRESLSAKFSENNPGWVRSKSCLAEMIALAQSRSVRLIVISFPVLSGINEEPYPFGDYIQTICNAVRANGVECLDVVPALQSSKIRLTVSTIEKHPSAEVYAIVAEKIGGMFHQSLSYPTKSP